MEQLIAGAHKIKSENSFKAYLTILLGGGIGMFGLCYYLFSLSLTGPYPQIAGIIIGSLFGMMGLLCLFCIYRLETIFIHSGRMEIRSILGNTRKIILINDIITWTEIEKKTKYTSWTDLTIYTELTRYTLPSSIYRNYDELKTALITGKPRDVQRQDKWVSKNHIYYACGFAIIGIFFLYGSYHIHTTNNNEIKPSDLKTITGIVTGKNGSKSTSKRHRKIEVKLQAYPIFSFSTATDASQGMYTSNINNGDMISLDILKEAYQMKLSKEKTPGFWDKTINYSSISVYGIRDARGGTYMSLEDYNNSMRNEAPFSFWFCAISGMCLLWCALYYYQISKNGNQKNSIS